MQGRSMWVIYYYCRHSNSIFIWFNWIEILRMYSMCQLICHNDKLALILTQLLQHFSLLYMLFSAITTYYIHLYYKLFSSRPTLVMLSYLLTHIVNWRSILLTMWQNIAAETYLNYHHTCKKRTHAWPNICYLVYIVYGECFIEYCFF